MNVPRVPPHDLKFRDLKNIPCGLRDLLYYMEQNEEETAAKQVVDSLVNRVVDIVNKDMALVTINQIITNIENESTKKIYDINITKETQHFYFENVVVDNKTCISTFISTLDQYKIPLWKKERSVRISCSTKAHKIKTRIGNFETLAAEFADPNREFKGNEHTQYGCNTESEAIKKYVEIYKELITNSGLIIHLEFPWLCGTPDSIVITKINNIKKVLEIKCPSKCKHTGLKNTVDEKENSQTNKKKHSDFNVPFLYYNEKGDVDLKKSDKFYTQCQLLMFLTGVNICDLFIYTKVDQILIEVHRDDDFIDSTLDKVNRFYFDYLLPELVRVSQI